MSSLLQALAKQLADKKAREEKEGGTEYDVASGEVRYRETGRKVEDPENSGGDETYGSRKSHTSN